MANFTSELKVRFFSLSCWIFAVISDATAKKINQCQLAEIWVGRMVIIIIYWIAGKDLGEFVLMGELQVEGKAFTCETLLCFLHIRFNFCRWRNRGKPQTVCGAVEWLQAPRQGYKVIRWSNCRQIYMVCYLHLDFASDLLCLWLPDKYFMSSPQPEDTEGRGGVVVSETKSRKIKYMPLFKHFFCAESLTRAAFKERGKQEIQQN